MKYICTRKQMTDIADAIRKKYGYVDDSEVTSLDEVWKHILAEEIEPFNTYADYSDYYNTHDIVIIDFDVTESDKDNPITMQYQDIVSVVYDSYITDLDGVTYTLESPLHYKDGLGRVWISAFDYEKFSDIITICPYYKDETTNNIYKICIDNT